jgi:hypothetical protein
MMSSTTIQERRDEHTRSSNRSRQHRKPIPQSEVESEKVDSCDYLQNGMHLGQWYVGQPGLDLLRHPTPMTCVLSISIYFCVGISSLARVIGLFLGQGSYLDAWLSRNEQKPSAQLTWKSLHVPLLPCDDLLWPVLRNPYAPKCTIL